ncbi:Rv2732c family membrane protein [Umezawaea beigongshangensis]|uniref:Rv2732c family membrane protein n=1 Tax=Umezawaea beigongshangensis TaxID=2780383 RepID=UPI0027DDE8B8|nr:hypothetical protein [Umezawaea beigongshangensis]
MSQEPEDVAGLRAEIDQVGRSAARRVDPGPGALVIAITVLVIMVAFVLPWVGAARGYDVLLGQVPTGVDVGLLPRVFAWTAVGVGVLLTALTLVLQRWVLAWTCTLGCFAGSVAGVLSIWSTQTTTSHLPGPGPGAGLVLAVVGVVVLLVRWVKLAASRSGL